MQCSRCQHDNPDAAKFCGGCGGPLEALCLSCRATNPPGNKFCHQCGTGLGSAPRAEQAVPPVEESVPRAYTPKHLADKILSSRSAVEGERKQVTVLFVDVSGFTSIASRLDPEEVHALMTRAFELMLAEVHRYEGTVNQFLGDGIMALFGAPIAHEDHARRAVHAALGIRAALAGLPGRAPAAARHRLPGAPGPQHGPRGRRQHRQRPPHGLHRGGGHHQRGGAAPPGRRARPGRHLRSGPARGRRLLRDRGPGARSRSRARASRCRRGSRWPRASRARGWTSRPSAG